MHALGIVSINYNSFEHGLLAIFRHHLDAKNVPENFSDFVFGKANREVQVAMIREIFDQCESDWAVKDCVEHLLSYYAWCYQSRDLLMHSHQNFQGADTGEHLLSLAKRKRDDYSAYNYMHLSLPHLRAIADNMHAGYLFLLNLNYFLMARAGKVDAEILKGFPPRLPSKPPIPRQIKLRDQPVSGGDT